MRLSKYFTLREMARSAYAERNGIDNHPLPHHVEALGHLCAEVLDPVREKFGAFSPNSGYRSRRLNSLLGGSRTSQHMDGQAVDFEVPGVPNLVLARWVRDNLTFDQLILEFHLPGDPTSGWVHCSWVHPTVRQNRSVVLTIQKGKGYVQGLPEG